MIRKLIPVATLLLAAGFAAPAVAAQACAGQPGAGAVKLNVAAAGVRSGKGEVVFTLFPDDRKRFLAKGGKLLRTRVASSAGTVRSCFWVKPGHYAAALYHDENGDHDFNRTLFAPKEGFGFSNDAPTTFGLPKFSAVRFAVPASGASPTIRMRYAR